MKGYIIYDAATGAVKHHGIHPKLPLPSMGQEAIEISPEKESLLTPGRAYFVGKQQQILIGDLVTSLGNGLMIESRAIRASATPANPDSSLEAAIRENSSRVAENTAEVRALRERLDKMFNL